MFCTRCGTPVEPVDNFCKNCGAGLMRSSAPGSIKENPGTATERLVAPIETGRKPDVARPRAGSKPQVFSPSRERKGLGTIFIGLGLAVVFIAGSALYFGTDLFREPAKQEKPPVAKSPTGGAVSPGALPGDESIQARKAPADRLASAPKPSEPGSSNNSPPQAASKSPPGGSTVPATRKTPLQAKVSSGEAGGAPASPASAGRAPLAGTYETTRSTPVYESPSDSANVVANIPGGVRVNVVSAKGAWLEVHSKRGNPPGYIRRQDVTLLEKAN